MPVHVSETTPSSLMGGAPVARRTPGSVARSLSDRLIRLKTSARLGAGLGASLVAGALLLAPTGAEARLAGKGPFGLGVAFGEPTQLTGKYLTGRGAEHALQFGVSWSFRNDWFGGTIDYLYQFWNVIPKLASGAIEVPIYVGIGGALWIDTHDHDHDHGRFHDHDHDTDFILGPRIPVGIALAWTRVPLEVFVEVAPYLFVIPEVRGDLGGQIGARWYF